MFFSEIDADMLKGGIEMLYERDGLKLKLEYQSLSTILLKLLALNIIESDDDIMNSTLLLTDFGKESVLSLVEF